MSCTKSKLNGGLFYEKNANSCICGPTMWAVSNKQTGCLPSSPKWTNQNFLKQFLLQNQNSNWVYFIETIDISCFEGPMGQTILVKLMPADWPKIWRHSFCPNGCKIFFWPNRMQGGRVIRLFIVHGVTE